MKGELFEVSGKDGRVLTRGRFFRGSKTPGNVVIAQVWLGATIDKPNWFISDLRENADRYWDFSLFAVEHPGHDLNKTSPDEKIIWTLQDCEKATQHALNHILSQTETKKLIAVGNSLGFWALFNAIAKWATGMDPRFLGLLGKSWITSYFAVLGKILQKFWSEHDQPGAWKKFMEHIRMDEKTGWWEWQVNPGDPVVPIHRDLINLISGLIERTAIIGQPVETWQWELDTYCSAAEMRTHNEWRIVVHEQKHLGHSLCHSGNDTVSRAVNQEMIRRIKEIFERGN